MPIGRHRNPGLERQRVNVREVRVAEPQVGHPLVVVEDLRYGVDLGDGEETAGLDKVSRYLRPAIHVWQPAEDTARGVDDVGGPVQVVGKVV